MKALLVELHCLKGRASVMFRRTHLDSRYHAGEIDGLSKAISVVQRRTEWSPANPELAQGNHD